MATIGLMKPYQGSCHCGRVRFEIRTELTRVSECNCSICRRKGYLQHMVTPDRFRLSKGGYSNSPDLNATFTFVCPRSP
jgi:hypothetical protein